MKFVANEMVESNPSIRCVYAIDNSYEVARDYKTAYKKNSIESWAIFKDLLERDGLRIV